MDKFPPIIGKEYYDERYFNQYPEYFDSTKSKFQQYRLKNVLKLYTPDPTETVLDMGMGWGTFIFNLAQFCKSVIGIDFSIASLRLCSDLLTKHPQGNIQITCADVQAVPFSAESFDVLIGADLIEHLYPDQFEKFLNECVRLLKKHGKLVLWTPNEGHWVEQVKKINIFSGSQVSHVDFKTMGRIQDALRSHGFTVLKAYYVASHLPMIREIERRLLGICSFTRRRIAVLGEKF